MKNRNLSLKLAREAKAMVAIAFRNGPIEDIHAGLLCPACSGKAEYSHITNPEMKRIMQNAVDHLYQLLWLRDNNPEEYQEQIDFGSKYTIFWDDPVEAAASRKRTRPHDNGSN